jgi:hypothetical protein
MMTLLYRAFFSYGSGSGFSLDAVLDKTTVLIKVMQICNYLPTNLPRLQVELPQLPACHVMRVRIRLLTLMLIQMWIRIRRFTLIRIQIWPPMMMPIPTAVIWCIVFACTSLIVLIQCFAWMQVSTGGSGDRLNKDCYISILNIIQVSDTTNS